MRRSAMASMASCRAIRIPTEYHDAVTGAAKPVEDTPFNRAWFAAGKLFADEAKRMSFYQRVEKMMPIAATRNTGSMSTASPAPSISRCWRSRRRAIRFQDDFEGVTDCLRCGVP